MQPVKNGQNLSATASTDNKSSSSVQAVNANNILSSNPNTVLPKSESKISAKDCSIIQGYLDKDKKVYCFIGNLDNDQKNHEATINSQLEAEYLKEKLQAEYSKLARKQPETRWFEKSLTSSLAKCYPTMIPKK